MGLDMYLEGKKFIFTDWKNSANNPREDGFELKEKVLRLGYWRKHPNLHGFIVQTFANGEDKHQEIELGKDEINQTISAIEKGELPYTTGFFFGESDGSEKDDDIKTFRSALEWLQTKEERVSRSIVYHASW